MDNDTPSADRQPFERDAFVRTVGDFCQRTLALTASTKILVAVSGGADSVALYRVLRELGYAIEIALFDHRTRGGASTQDAEFVAGIAATDRIPFHTAHADVAAGAAATGDSFEMHARRLRYAFLLRTAEASGCSHMATGHHAEDQAETVLMRVLRGATGHGLAGIPPARNEHGVLIVRPLLSMRRNDILGYLESIGADYREDTSNRNELFLRNRIRHTLIPALERDYNPQVVAALSRLAESQRVEHEWLDAAAEQAAAAVIECAAIDRKKFTALHEAIQRRVFQKFAWGLGIDCAYDRVVAGVSFVTRGDAGSWFDAGSGISLVNGATVTEVATQTASSVPDEVILTMPGTTRAFAREFTVRALDSLPDMPLADYCTPCRQVFDRATIRSLAVRRVQTGDRFVPFGMSGSRKLSDYLTDLKLPPSERAAQLVLMSAEQIVWVVGRAVSANAAVTARTTELIEVEIADADL